MTAATSNELQQKHASNRLIPVPEWNKHYPWPPQGGIRHLRFNQNSNGFKSAFKKVGRRVLIDEREFFACIERQNGGDK